MTGNAFSTLSLFSETFSDILFPTTHPFISSYRSSFNSCKPWTSKALQNIFWRKCEIHFSRRWQTRYRVRRKLLRNGIQTWPLQMFEHLTVSSSGWDLWENVPLRFPKQPWFFWHHRVTLHGPFPLPPLGCALRQWVLQGVILLASGARALSPSSQYVPRGGREGGKQADEHMWAQGQAHSHKTFI